MVFVVSNVTLAAHSKWRSSFTSVFCASSKHKSWSEFSKMWFLCSFYCVLFYCPYLLLLFYPCYISLSIQSSILTWLNGVATAVRLQLSNKVQKMSTMKNHVLFTEHIFIWADVLDAWRHYLLHCIYTNVHVLLCLPLLKGVPRPQKKQPPLALF